MSAYKLRSGSYCTKEARSSVRLYRLSYLVTASSFPLLRRLFPRHVTNPVNLGKAMIRVALSGYSKQILETHDTNLTNALAAAGEGTMVH
jgi:hypothetical protein